jgi:hypothetical protein
MSSAALGRQVGEVLVYVEVGGSRNVTREVVLSPATGAAELPATVDELVLSAHDGQPLWVGLGATVGSWALASWVLLMRGTKTGRARP